jgi:hypothetical protein
MARRDRARWGEEGRSESTAGAWAAAAVVLALGALGFGVASQLQVQDLERRVDSLERTTQIPVTSRAPATTAPPVTTTVTGGGAGGAVLPDIDKEGVERAYGTVYDGSRPTQDRLAYVDDPSGIVASLERVSSGELSQTATQLRAVVDRVTFTSTMTATVSYRLATGADAGSAPERIGSARRVGGTWKVTRSTVCGDLEDAGAPCGG